MIINSTRSKNESSREQWLFAGLMGFIILFFAWIVSSYFSSFTPPPLSAHEAVYCDAETVKKGFFVSGGFRFSNGSLQSADRARSGKFSCKVGLGEGVQYGFGYRLEDFRPGQTFTASVWRFKNQHNEGRLVVEGKGADSFYLQEDRPVERDGNGWEKIEIRFFAPYGKKLDVIDVYVYTSGFQEVYFDDLKIEESEPLEQNLFKPEILRLEISSKGMEELNKKREEALRNGILETGDKDWVNGKILVAGSEPTPVKLRLKGDWLDHLQGDKWSFRIRAKDPHSWKQMTSFSLHTPSTRYFLHEWLLHRLWEKEDVLTTRYDFVELYLNGRSLGVYAYEEHFEKELVESRHRREGPILKFAEDGFWSGVKRQLNAHGYMKPGAAHSAMDWNNAPIEAFGENKITADPQKKTQFEQAQNLMFQFRNGLRKPSEIFDLERLARYYAVCDVLNAYHGVIWHNQRFFYNPLINKLEPIGFDGFGEEPPAQYTILGEGALNPEGVLRDNILSVLFQDAEFLTAYLRNLYRLSSREYLKSFFDEVWSGWEPRLQFLQMEFPQYRPELMDFMLAAQYVHSLLLPFNNQSIQTFTQSTSGGKKLLLVTNNHTLPLEAVGYGLNERQITYVFDTPLTLPAQIPRKFLRRLQRDSMIPDFDAIRFLESGALEEQAPRQYTALEVSQTARFLFFRLPGIDSLFHTPIRDRKRPEDTVASQQIFSNVKLSSNSFMTVEGNLITFREGRHRIDHTIAIPAGFQVFFEAGAELDLVNHAGFISRSTLSMYGNEDAPILITSSDKSANGFTVMEAPRRSELKHVIFDNLNTMRSNGWMLTGAVTFYESDVYLYRCVIRNNHCEDALNTIRCRFEMDRCLISDTFSDGFDSDFCKGTITNSSFLRTGNDGLDFSGSIVNVSNCRFEHNGDKGISVGEESDLTVFSSSIRHAPIAVASKDLSVLYLKDIDISDCDQGFVAFQKKPEFGCATIIVESYQARNIRRLHAISEGCKLQLDGRIVSR
jgi:hypothetical protein